MRLKTFVEITWGSFLEDCERYRLLDKINGHVNDHLKLKGVHLDSIESRLDEIEVFFSVPPDITHADLKTILVAVDDGLKASHDLGYGLFFGDINYEFIEDE